MGKKKPSQAFLATNAGDMNLGNYRQMTVPVRGDCCLGHKSTKVTLWRNKTGKLRESLLLWGTMLFLWLGDVPIPCGFLN